MCEKCEAAAAAVDAQQAEDLVRTALHLVKVFNATAEVNFAALRGNDLYQMAIYVAARCLAEGLQAMFGPERRKLAERLTALVVPTFLEVGQKISKEEIAGVVAAPPKGTVH